ncbi:MAG TPA: hypothetical protein DCY27_10880 [Desulfobacterales bacterium]|nr:hypothetical protein [Desulfobacterales bacterium]
MGISVYFGVGRQPEKTGYADIAIGLEPTALKLKVHHNLDLLGTGSLPLPAEVLKFLLISLGIWSADKVALRGLAADAWTRSLKVSLPAAAWETFLPELAVPLTFLTGDAWDLEARAIKPSLEISGKPDLTWRPDCICLFSGGVDSLAGAVDLLEDGRNVLLVSHYDFGQLAAGQKILAQALIEHYGAHRVRRWGFRVQFEAPELSLRSRSLLFIALGLAAAAVWGENLPLVIPENGWISLNPPLTGNRLGSYSTRTTHPYFISGLKQFWVNRGIAHDLGNPYQEVTKGEMLARSRNPALIRDLLSHTISCAHPVASRWLKGRQGNCGYCFPCLMRRAALHTLGWDDGRQYAIDVLRQPEVWRNRARGADLRSLLYAVEQWQLNPQPRQLLWRSGPLPVDQAEGEKLIDLVGRGLTEVSRWLSVRQGNY